MQSWTKKQTIDHEPFYFVSAVWTKADKISGKTGVFRAWKSYQKAKEGFFLRGEEEQFRS